MTFLERLLAFDLVEQETDITAKAKHIAEYVYRIIKLIHAKANASSSVNTLKITENDIDFKKFNLTTKDKQHLLDAGRRAVDVFYPHLLFLFR